VINTLDRKEMGMVGPTPEKAKEVGFEGNLEKSRENLLQRERCKRGFLFFKWEKGGSGRKMRERSRKKKSRIKRKIRPVRWY